MGKGSDRILSNNARYEFGPLPSRDRVVVRIPGEPDIYSQDDSVDPDQFREVF